MSFAEIIHVPADYNSIQLAIGAAAIGDTVLISDGEYPENIHIENRSITLASRYLLDQDTLHITNTIIRSVEEVPDSNHRAITIINDSLKTIRIVGLSITGGYLDPFDNTGISRGGGLYGYNTELNISYCHIYDNISHSGAGIYLMNSDLVLTNSFIISNSFGGLGGGLFINNDMYHYYSFISIEDNTFENNTTYDGIPGNTGNAAAMILTLSVQGTLSGNIISNNESNNGSGSINLIIRGLIEAETVWYVDNNTFIDNIAGRYTALYIAKVEIVSVKNNIFFNNTADDDNYIIAWGGGLAIGEDCSDVLIENNRFEDNRADGGASAAIIQSSAIVRENIFIRNYGYVYGAIASWRNQGHDNIIVNMSRNIFYQNGQLRNHPNFLGQVTALNRTTLILNENDFINNHGYATGLHEDEQGRLEGEIIAANNYWGDPTGPYHDIENPGGLGDSVRDNVSIIPFSETPFTMPDSFGLMIPSDEYQAEGLPVYFLWYSAPDRTTLEPVTYTLELSPEPDFAEFDPVPTGTDTGYALTEAD